MTAKIAAKDLHESFEKFAELFLFQAEAEPMYITPSQRAICKHLQYGPQNLQLSCFRNAGKSILTEAFCAWILYNDPQKRILVFSAASDRAKNFTLSLYNRFQTIPWLQHLRTQSGQRAKATEFDVGPAKTTQVPSVKALGIEARKQGNRANVIIYDDVESFEMTATDEGREKLLDQIKEGSSIILPLPDSRTIFLGTPQTQFSIYDKLAKDYPKFIWPVRYPNPAKMSDSYMDGLAPELFEALEEDPSLIGKPTCTRFPEEVIAQKERETGQEYFSLQMMLDTSLTDVDKYPLKFADLIVYPMAEELPEKIIWSNDKSNVLDLPAIGLQGDRYYSPAAVGSEFSEPDEVIVSVDVATTGKDETAAVVIAAKDGRFFLKDMLCFMESSAQESRIKDVLALCRRHQATTLLVETNQGGDMMIHNYNRVAQEVGLAIKVEGVRAAGQKEIRIIDALEPVMASHLLVVDPKVIQYDFRSNAGMKNEQRKAYTLAYQLSRMNREKNALKHDDRIDSLAQALKWLSPHGDRSAAVEAQIRDEEARSAYQDLEENFPQQHIDALVRGCDPVAMLKALRSSKGRSWDWSKTL